MKPIISIFLLFAVSIILPGCEQVAAPDGIQHQNIQSIVDPILIDASDDILPAGKQSDTIHIFELSDVPLVSSGEYNDFDLTYWSTNSCDIDVWIFNFTEKRWDQIGFELQDCYCCMMPTRQKHLFSGKGLRAEDYLDTNMNLLFHGPENCHPILRALKINPDYHAVPLLHSEFQGFSGITTDKETFLLSSREKLYRLSYSGELLHEYEVPSEYPHGLAFDGDRFWLADGSNYIFALNNSIQVECVFSVPTDYPGGIAWAFDRIWLTEYGGSTPRTFVIDAGASCEKGAAVVERTLQTPGGESRGITWDEEHLLVLSDKLYKMSIDGNVEASYELPVIAAGDLTWDGSSVWILNIGPKNVRSNDPVVSRFRLPDVRQYTKTQ